MCLWSMFRVRHAHVRGHVVHVSSCACSWSCFMCLNMNDQGHELEHQVNCVLTPPSPFSFRARMRASMDATMSCFTNSAVAAYVRACVFVVSRFRQAHPITAKHCADFQSILIVLLCAGEIPVQRASSLRSLRLERSFKYVAGRHVYAICHLSNAGLKVTHLISLRMRLRGDRSTARSRRPFTFTSPHPSRLMFNFGSTLRGALKHTTHSALTAMQLQQVPDEADERCATRLRLRQQSLGRPTIG